MFSLNLAITTGFSFENLVKVNQAKDAIEKVFNSDTFKNSVLNFTYDGAKSFYYHKTLFGTNMIWFETF